MTSASLAWATTEGGWSPQLSQTRETKAPLKPDFISGPSPFSPGSHNLAIDVGQMFLMGDLNTRYNDSLGLRLHYTYGVSDLFSFDSFLGYSEHSDAKFVLSYLTSGLRMNLSWYDKLIPYGILGLGFYRPSHVDQSMVIKKKSFSQTISSVVFGIHTGGGVDLQLNQRVFFGVALTFHKLFNVERQFANGTPLSLGGTVSSFFVRGGFTL